MSSIIIFGKNTCPFTLKAADYCTKNRIVHEVHDLHSDELVNEVKRRFGAKTIPVILLTEDGQSFHYIGGYSELRNLFT